MHGIMNRLVENVKSSWIKTLQYSENTLTVTPRKGKSFDLHGVTVNEFIAINGANMNGESVGRLVNQLTAVRDKEGNLK